MKRFVAIAFVSLGLALPSTASATPVLQEDLFNLNGALFHNTEALPGMNTAGFNSTTGLGTLTLTFNPGVAGNYFFDAFFDEQLHIPFYDEFGAVGGVPGAGISWQIDEPEFGDANRVGTIFTNTSNNGLDNTNHIPGILSNDGNDCGGNGGGPANPNCNNDVSAAMGFNFILAATEQAVITLNISQARPNGGFFLQLHSPANGNQAASDVFLTGAIEVGPGGSTPPPNDAVPEPASLVLLGTGLIGVIRRRSRKAISKSAE